MLKAWGECLIQGVILRDDRQLKVLRDGVQLDDDVVLLVEGGHLRSDLTKERQMIDKLFDGFGIVIQPPSGALEKCEEFVVIWSMKYFSWKS